LELAAELVAELSSLIVEATEDSAELLSTADSTELTSEATEDSTEEATDEVSEEVLEPEQPAKPTVARRIVIKIARNFFMVQFPFGDQFALFLPQFLRRISSVNDDEGSLHHIE